MIKKQNLNLLFYQDIVLPARLERAPIDSKSICLPLAYRRMISSNQTIENNYDLMNLSMWLDLNQRVLVPKTSEINLTPLHTEINKKSPDAE